MKNVPSLFRRYLIRAVIITASLLTFPSLLVRAQTQQGTRCFAHSRGRFQEASNIWQEYFDGKPTYRFQQAAGDDSSFIYVFDSTRNLTLAIPKQGGSTRVRWGSGPWTNGYQVQVCSPGVVQPGQTSANQAANQSCVSNQQCTSGNCFDHVCHPLKPDGQSCVANQECASKNCYDHVCRTLKPDGQSCVANQECASKNCYDHVCRTLKPDGQSCVANQECASKNCYDHVCRTLKPDGQSCVANQECASKNCYDHVCRPTH